MTRALIFVVMMAFAVATPSIAVHADEPTLSGRLLVASPHMRDPRFGRSVVLLTRHVPVSNDGAKSERPGAMGFIVNKVVSSGRASDVLSGFGVHIGKDATNPIIDLHYGGPVQARQGFVLHGNDYSDPSTLQVNAQLSLTLSPDVMNAIAKGTGPKSFVVLLGYAGWGPGQLEKEIKRGDWDTIEATPPMIFGHDNAIKWPQARETVGVPL